MGFGSVGRKGFGVNTLPATPWGFGMLSIPNGVTGSALVRIRVLRPATVGTNPAIRPYRIMPTLPRAVFGRAFDPANVELFAAMSTSERTACIADKCARASRLKQIATSLAGFGYADVRVAPRLHQLRVSVPELCVCPTVTLDTQGFKVRQSISLDVVIEQVERALVVNLKSIGCGPTALARIRISLKGLLALFVPVRATGVNMSTLPVWVVRSDPFRGLTPKTKTPTTAKVMFRNSTWLPVKDFAAGVTRYLNFRAAKAFAVYTLPKTVAHFVTEVMFGQGLSVRLGFKLGSALVTG